MPKRDSSVLCYVDIETAFLDRHTFRNALGEKLWHAVELALDAVQAPELCSLDLGKRRSLHSANMLGGLV
jgi:hypothetical protein